MEQDGVIMISLEDFLRFMDKEKVKGLFDLFEEYMKDQPEGIFQRVSMLITKWTVKPQKFQDMVEVELSFVIRKHPEGVALLGIFAYDKTTIDRDSINDTINNMLEKLISDQDDV